MEEEKTLLRDDIIDDLSTIQSKIDKFNKEIKIYDKYTHFNELNENEEEYGYLLEYFSEFEEYIKENFKNIDKYEEYIYYNINYINTLLKIKEDIYNYSNLINMILTKISQYSQKEKHRDQIDLIKNIDFWYNKFYQIHKSKIKQEEVELLEEKILKAIEKSNTDNSCQYIIPTIQGVEHTLPLFIHKNKIIIFDSMFKDTNELYKIYIKRYITDNFLKKYNIPLKIFSLKNQTDYKSCPVFTVRNLIKVDKFFKENPDYFDKIFDTEIEEDGMKILQLFPLLQDIQSISQIEELSGIKIEYNTEPQEDSFVIENHKKEKIIINVKDEEKAKIFFGSTKEEQEEKLKKLVKYMEFNKLEKKLQNLRIDVKREKYYKDLEKVSDELLDYVNEKVVNSLC